MRVANEPADTENCREAGLLSLVMLGFARDARPLFAQDPQPFKVLYERRSPLSEGSGQPCHGDGKMWAGIGAHRFTRSTIMEVVSGKVVRELDFALLNKQQVSLFADGQVASAGVEPVSAKTGPGLFGHPAASWYGNNHGKAVKELKAHIVGQAPDERVSLSPHSWMLPKTSKRAAKT